MNFHPAPVYLCNFTREGGRFCQTAGNFMGYLRQKLQKSDKKTCIYDSCAVYLLVLWICQTKNTAVQRLFSAGVSTLPQLGCALMFCFDFDCAVAPRYILHCAEAAAVPIMKITPLQHKTKVIFDYSVQCKSKNSIYGKTENGKVSENIPDRRAQSAVAR